MGKKSKKIYDFHTLSTKIHKVFHKMWINIFLKLNIMALRSIFSLYLFAYLTFYYYIAEESKKRRLYEKVNEFSRVYSEIFV